MRRRQPGDSVKATSLPASARRVLFLAPVLVAIVAVTTPLALSPRGSVNPAMRPT